MLAVLALFKRDFVRIVCWESWMKLHGGGADRPLTCWENELELAGGPQEGKCYQISPATQNSFFKQNICLIFSGNIYNISSPVQIMMIAMMLIAMEVIMGILNGRCTVRWLSRLEKNWRRRLIRLQLWRREGGDSDWNCEISGFVEDIVMQWALVWEVLPKVQHKIRFSRDECGSDVSNSI